MDSSCSSLLTDDNEEVTSTLTSKSSSDREIYLPNSTIFIISLYENHRCQLQKRFSLDTPLISYSLIIRLINRIFHLHSNFILQSKDKTIIKDDLDLDSCILHSFHQNYFQFSIQTYPIDDWCIIEDQIDENFDLIEMDNNCIIVSIRIRRENFLQRATNWLHGNSNHSMKCLTKKEFIRMFDSSNGRLINENLFRQRIYETGCEQNIRKIVWCYLLRIFNSYMTNDDKVRYMNNARDQYNKMKRAWSSKEESDLESLRTSIEKDVTRTDSSIHRRNLCRTKLLNIIMTYCVYHPEPGYAQGMTDMVAPILYVVRDEALTYACFCTLMRYMSPLFHSNGLAINRRLDLFKRTIQAIDGELWKKIEQCDIGNLMFAYRWLLLDCKREFPFKDTFRIFETLWAALPIDRFELDSHTESDLDDLCPSSLCPDRHHSMTSSISNTILSADSSSEEFRSDSSSTDEHDSGYRDEQTSSRADSPRNSSEKPPLTIMSCLPLEKWLKHFSSIIHQIDDSDMFTIFLCMALLEQNRSSLMQVATINVDRDDYLGFYFTRLVRQNHAQEALQLARHYHRQYLAFRMRMKQFLLTEN